MERRLTALSALSAALDAGSYDVSVVRWLDGHRISPPVRLAVPGSAVLSLFYEEQCLPGVLAAFNVVPSAPRDTPMG